jgi:hypothetical protein
MNLSHYSTVIGKNGSLSALPLLMYFNIHCDAVLEKLAFFLKHSEY